MDVMELVDETLEEEGVTVYVVRWSVLYPALVARIRECLERNVRPRELLDLDNPNPDVPVDAAARLYRGHAQALPDGALDLALTPADECPAELLADRAAALELCRKWFTRALKNRHGLGRQLVLRLVPDDRGYRLTP